MTDARLSRRTLLHAGGAIGIAAANPAGRHLNLGVLPLQQLAHAVAVARGHDPDAPRGLAKVTLTR